MLAATTNFIKSRALENTGGASHHPHACLDREGRQAHPGPRAASCPSQANMSTKPKRNKRRMHLSSRAAEGIALVLDQCTQTSDDMCTVWPTEGAAGTKQNSGVGATRVETWPMTLIKRPHGFYY